MMVLFPTPSLMSTKCLKKLINCTKTIGNCSKEGYRFLLVIEKCACGVRGYVSVTCGKLFHLIDWIVYIRLMDIWLHLYNYVIFNQQIRNYNVAIFSLQIRFFGAV